MNKGKSFAVISRLALVLSAALLTISSGANAAVVTGDERVNSPFKLFITTDGEPVVIDETFGPSEEFYHSFRFRTDSEAQQGSSAVVGLDLDGLSGFEGDLVISLYQGNYREGDTIVGSPIATATGTNLSNVGVLASTQYSLIISGLTTATPFNIITGSIAVTSVPLPAAAWLFGSALLGLTMVARRRTSIAA